MEIPVKISLIENAEKFNPGMAIPDRPRHNNPMGVFGTGERYRVTFEDRDGTRYFRMIPADEVEDYVVGMEGTILTDGDKVISWSNRDQTKPFKRLIRAAAILLLVALILLFCYWVGSSAEKKALSSVTTGSLLTVSLYDEA